ncbi:AcrR family transcriptional regulator [Novosphingobium chloroacetimidivorans]|uniref:AcrR family transcriptional regulator n=1 Tax=Novosphingobium chloroacetimidivorans TaxID=1428314 RepID=A0A7W7KDY5_9SPHN|nr:TetR family transcriptional regulator [Novosphingobium chloroacetimidivorans]MBB4860313.1 AcrR family transcriptional regulator [Novosphingobium chloroacetimidivorans]
MSRKRNLEGDAKSRILEISARLFAEHGFNAISVRDITSEAGVNIGAVNYYFQSKEQLFHEIFETLLRPLQRERIALLDQIEAEAVDASPDPERILRALIEPTIRSSVGKDALSPYLPRLMFQTYAVARQSIGDDVAVENDAVATRFIKALARAIPHVSYEDICWRYYMVLGGFLLVCTDAQGAQRLERLSDGRCDTNDGPRIIEQMIAFFLSGITGPAPSKPRRRAAKALPVNVPSADPAPTPPARRRRSNPDPSPQ